MTPPSDDVLAQAAHRFGIDAGSITFLRESVNAIYQFTHHGQGYVLRLTPAAQRDEHMLHGEMDWMDYLARHRGHVPTPLRSTGGRLVETVGDPGATFLAVVFEKVPGLHPEGEMLNDDVLHLWGQALGRMHRLSKTYHPPTPAIKRPHWHELDAFQLERRIPASQPLVLQKYHEMVDYLHALPVDEEAYGLIHADPEPWNFLLHEGQITFIDFDECCYHWFVFDLAVSLMYAVVAAEVQETDAFARHAWRCLYRGYRQENQLSGFWIRRMPAFLRFRVMQDYAFHLNVWDLESLNEWQKGTLRQHRHVIESGAPLLNITFENLQKTA